MGPAGESVVAGIVVHTAWAVDKNTTVEIFIEFFLSGDGQKTACLLLPTLNPI